MIEPAEAHTSAGLAARRSVAWAQALAFVLARCCSSIIRAVGVQQSSAALSRVGFGFFLVVAMNVCVTCCALIANDTVPPNIVVFTFVQAFAPDSAASP